MSDDLGFLHDHGEIAWGNFLAQHVGKSNTEALVRSLYPPLNTLDQALRDLYTKRGLDTAVGVQLDGIGSIVGITRFVPNGIYIPFFGFQSQPSGRGFGIARMRHSREPWAASSILGDIEYRVVLYTKIAYNNGHGTAEEICAAMNAVMGTTGTRILDVGNATARIYINAMPLPSDPSYYLMDYMIPRAAGVKIFPFFVNAAHTFGFRNQEIYFGFGIGVLARSRDSNIPAIVEAFTTWDNGESPWDDGQTIWDIYGINPLDPTDSTPNGSE
jgi:hypothetical protein